jgi:AcrR family transcriptional regulator
MDETQEEYRSTSTASANTERQQRILTAASALIVRYGYDKTTVAEIAETAGISKGAIYLHFESKEALFEELVYYESEKLLSTLLTQIENGMQINSFFDVYRDLLQLTANTPLLKALLTRDRRVLGDMLRNQRSSHLFKAGSGFTRDFIQELQAQGVVRDDLTTQQVLYLMGIIRFGLLVVDEHLLPDDVLPLDEIGPALAEFLDRGLSPDGGGDRTLGKEMIIRWARLGQQMLALRRQQKFNGSSGE